jgi:hypothetical protein
VLSELGVPIFKIATLSLYRRIKQSYRHNKVSSHQLEKFTTRLDCIQGYSINHCITNVLSEGARCCLMARVDVAYGLWFVGGFFGLHHLYLGDDVKAFLYFISGGGFGFGTLRDLWCIPSYVRQANNPDEPEPIVKRKSFPLMMALFVTTFLFGRLATLAFAPSWFSPWWWQMVVRAFGVSLAAYLVAWTSKHRVVRVSFGGLLLVSGM